MRLSNQQTRKLINILTVVSSIIIVILCIYWYKLGIFSSEAKMKAYLADKKVVGPVVFILIQIIKSWSRSSPAASPLGGVVFFGAIPGFIYNYTDRHRLLDQLLSVPPEGLYPPHREPREPGQVRQVDQEPKAVQLVLRVAILAPVAPDDLLCLWRA